MDDRAEIADLLARYAIACDRRRFDDLRDLFTPDAQATFSGVRLEPGVDNIVAHMQPMNDFPVTQHVVGSIAVHVDGDTATAISYTTVHVVRPLADGHDVVHRGLSYDDQLVRTADGWRFRERYHQVLWSTTEPTEWPVPAFKAS